MKSNIRSIVMIMAFLGLFAGVAMADDAAGKSGSAPNHEQWCVDNPQKCQKMKTRRAERKAKCEAKPDECEKRREEKKNRRAERKAKCEANPEECKKRKSMRR